VDELIAWLTEKNQSGYKMVNPSDGSRTCGHFMRGAVQLWDRRAGQNSMIIRTDGTLAPCYPMYSATYDWGLVADHKLDVGQLDSKKQTCQAHCFSELNHNLAYCYKPAALSSGR
jgi:hypothetical protein